MKILFLSILFLLSSCAPSLATTYYVSTTGNNGNTGLGITDGLAWLTLQYAESQVAANDTVQVLAGTYTIGFDTVIAGTSGNEITFEAYDLTNKPLLNGTAAQVINIQHAYRIVRGFEIIGTSRGIRIVADNVLVDQCNIHDTISNGIYSNSAGATNIIISRTRISDTGQRTVAVDDGGIKLHHCIVEGYRPAAPNNSIAVYIKGTGTSELLNCSVLGGVGNAIYANGAGVTLDVKNTIISGYGLDNDNALALTAAGGSTLTYSYNLISSNMRKYSKTVSSGTDQGNNLVGSQYIPDFVSTRYKGEFIISVDDFLDDMEEMATKVELEGFVFSANVSWYFAKDEEDLEDRLLALHTSGHDLVNQTRTHSDLQGTLNGELQYDGAESSPTVDIDHTADTIELRTTEGTDDLTLSSTSTKEITDFETLIAASNWSYTNESNQKAEVFLEALQDTSGAAALTGTPPVIDFDYNLDSFYSLEIGWTKTWLEGIATYTQKAIVYPFWSFNDTVIDGCITEGLLAGRGITSLNGYDMRHLIIFEIPAIYTGIKADGTETEIRRMVRQVTQGLTYTKGIQMFTIHEIDTDPTSDQMDWIIDELTNSLDYVNVTTLSAIAEDVVNSGDWTDFDEDGRIWARSFTGSADYSPKASSPVVDAGVDVGLSVDFAGNAITTVPEIGAYEFIDGSRRTSFIN